MNDSLTFDAWYDRTIDFEHDGLRQSVTDTGGDGPVILLLHGYPTWSYDWVDVIPALSETYRVIAPDWLGYGLSDKPSRHVPIKEQIDRPTLMLSDLGVDTFHLVAHDYGSTCAQEIVSRPDLSKRVQTLTLLNGGVIFSAYRPTRTQKLLLSPLGPLVVRALSADRVRTKLDALRGQKLRDDQFDSLWRGMTHNDGMLKSHLNQRYILERRKYWPRWETALRNYPGPVQLIWGPIDPISGAHVLTPLRALLPKAEAIELDGIGHFVPDEAPDAVAQAIRTFVARKVQHD
ncbi:MAG: alpha/beta hydrolase [Pseudomonadota bacterium]